MRKSQITPKARGRIAAILAALFIVPAAFAQTVHGVALSWTYTQGTDTAVAFNVYRGTTPGGPYMKLNALPISIGTSSYVDTTGNDGTVYYYVTTAIDATGSESTHSPEAQATAPHVHLPTPTIGSDAPSRIPRGKRKRFPQ
jgi:fibronectin type 3 domain-containing protein